MAPHGQVEIRVLGPFAVTVDGHDVALADFGGELGRRLLRRLAASRGSAVPRAALIEALWPRTRPADPEANLNVQVSRARRAIGGLVVETAPTGYRLTRGHWCTIDAERFDVAVHRSRELLPADPTGALEEVEGGLSLWTGDPLPEDRDRPWADHWRSQLRREWIEAQEIASRASIATGEVPAAIEHARAAAEADPIREAGQMALMRALAAAGDRVEALRTYEQLRRRLADELGVDPSPTAQRLHASLLRNASAVTDPDELGPARGTWPFLGRDAELERVRSTLAGGGIALVSGVSGAGKSRLLAEVARRLPGRCVVARAFAPDTAAPFTLAGSLLAELARVQPEAAAELPTPVRQALATIAPDLSTDADPVTASPRLDGQSRRALLLDGSARLFESHMRLGRVLIVDDAQWADASSLEVLARAAHRVDHLALAVAYRPGEGPAGQLEAFLAAVRNARHDVVAVELGDLPVAAVEALFDPGVARAIVDADDRSPLAVRQLVDELEVAGVLEQSSQRRWCAVTDDAGDRAIEALARGRRASWVHRLEAQPGERRDVVVALTLLGREAAAGLVAAAAGLADTGSAEDALDALWRAGLVALRSRGWALAHDDFGTAVRASLDPPELARAHARVADALPHADAGERARHLDAAADPRAAQEYAQAARERLDQFATDEAGRLASLGLDVPGSDPETHNALLEVRAETHYRAGELADAREDLRAALRRARTSEVRARLLAREATLASGSDDMGLASRLAEHALVEAGDDSAARAGALAVAAVIDMNMGRAARAARRSNEAERLYRLIGDTTGLADVLDARAMAGFLGGDVSGAVEAFDHVARLYEELGSLLRVVTPRSTRGHALLFADKPEAALLDADEALDRARSLGHTEGQAYVLWHRAEVLATLGRTEEGETTATEALDIARHIGHRGWTATAHRARGLVALAAQDLDTAEHSFRRSLDTSVSLDLFHSWAASGLATVLVRRGEIEDAREPVSLALRTGPALAGYEARLAHAEWLVDAESPEAPGVIRGARERSLAGGHVASLRRLDRLLAQTGVDFLSVIGDDVYH